MYTIKHAAQLVGVSVSTLRAWERRYGVGTTKRTAAGYRLYDDEAVRTLTAMHTLVLDGWSVRAAAEEVRRRRTATPDFGPETPKDEHPFVQVAAALDSRALCAVLEAGFESQPFEPMVDTWLLPGLRDVGIAWAGGRISVAGEHFVATAVSRRLSAAYEAAEHDDSGPRIVFGLPSGARHDLGLLAFATAMRLRGANTTYLGADVPAADWANVAETQPIDCVVLAAPMDADAEAAAHAIATVHARRPHALMAVGGSAQDLVLAPSVRLGHEIGTAAQTLAEHLARADASAR